MTAMSRLAVRSYPPSFRERYGAELEALVEDTGTSARTVLDLLLGAARAWLRPALATDGRRRRLQASVTTVWMAWCAGFLVVPAINRLLLDPPMPSVSGTDRSLLGAAGVLLIAGWVLALLGALPLAWRALVQARRGGDWRPLRPLLPTLVVGLADSALLVAVALVPRGHSPAHPSALFVVVTLAWLVCFLALVAMLGIAPALTVTRVRPDERTLRAPALLAAAVALCLAGTTATSLAASIDAGAGPFGTAVLTVGVLASLVALVSAMRGVRTAASPV